jgi:hypothetical protein
MPIEKYNLFSDDLFPLVISKRLYKILTRIDDKVSRILIDEFKSKSQYKETFIDKTDKEDMLSFITSDKVNKMLADKVVNYKDECWESPQRIEIKIGRLINRLIGNEIQNTDLENFINDYKAVIKAKNLNRNFKILQGEEIRKWYLRDNYVEGGGNLANSCMRFRVSQAFFNIYTENPDKIKMLILLDETKTKLLGRALLWYLDQPKGQIFMDRVYFSNDFILNMFINYAQKHNWLYKLESMDKVMQVVYNNRVKTVTMAIQITPKNFDTYPFVDTLCFYDYQNGILSNDPKYLEKQGCTEYYDLCEVQGEMVVRNDFDY